MDMVLKCVDGPCKDALVPIPEAMCINGETVRVRKPVKLSYIRSTYDGDDASGEEIPTFTYKVRQWYFKGMPSSLFELHYAP